MNENIKRFTLILPLELWKTIKHKAVEQNKPLQTYIIEQLTTKSKPKDVSTPEVELQQQQNYDDDVNMTLEQRLQKVKDMRNA